MSSERDPTRLMAKVKESAERLGGTYAFTLHAGASLIAPFVRFANGCGALAITRLGAQPSLPMAGEVAVFMAERSSAHVGQFRELC